MGDWKTQISLFCPSPQFHSAEIFMAKALIGYIGGPTTEQLRETASLHRRIADLEDEVLRLKVENDGLLRALRERVDQVTASDLVEPVSH